MSLLREPFVYTLARHAVLLAASHSNTARTEDVIRAHDKHADSRSLRQV